MRSSRRAALLLSLAIILVPLLPGRVSAHRDSQVGGRTASHGAGMVNPLLADQVERLLRQARQHTLASSPATPMVRLEITAQRDVAAAVRALGGQITADVTGHVIAARLPVEAVNRLAAQPGVEELYPVRRFHYTLDRSVPDIRANLVWAMKDRAGFPIQGRHVLIGDVDSGIDYRNPDFQNPDGSTRIKYIWDQTVDGTAPPGFDFGTECTSASINNGACPEKDTVGHGTHVMGIAAGNGRSSDPPREIGVAPEADIIMVKTDLESDHILAGWKYLIAKARQLGEPIVINNSFGSELSPHDGSEPDALAIDALSGPGRIFVAAAGNDGNQAAHTDGTLSQGGTANITVTARGHLSELTFGVFYGAGDQFDATLTNTATGESFGPLGAGEKIDSALSHDNETRVTIDTNAWDAHHHSVVVDLDRSSSGHTLDGTWRLSLIGTEVTDGGRYDAWLWQGSEGDQTFDNPDEADTVGDPADAHRVISVGDYATRVSWSDQNGATRSICDYSVCTHGVLQLGDIAATSSIGPTADGRQKPDISAPGTLIISSRSRDAAVCQGDSTDDCLDPLLITPDGKNYIGSGTSMAAPHVAGVIALMMQVAPALDPEAADSILRATARHDQFTGTAAWTPTFGAGKVDAYGAEQQALVWQPPPEVAPSPTPTPVPPPTFRILAVRAALHADKNGWRSSAGQPTVHVGQPVTLSIYSRWSGLQRATPVTVTWRVMRGGRTLWFKTAEHWRQPASALAWDHLTFVPQQPGSYSFEGGIALDSREKTAVTTFTATAG